MSKPQNPYPVPKWSVFSLRLMLAIALLACVFVIIQSCSLEQKPNLQRFAKGGLKKLQVLETPPLIPDMKFKTASGDDISLSDFRGKTVLLNIWATWCVPCIAEIPSLDTLQAQKSASDFTVITISMDRHIDDAKAFYADNAITNLALYHDPSYSMSAKLGVQGIPISVFYNPDGQEVARIAGEVDWQTKEVSMLLDEILKNN